MAETTDPAITDPADEEEEGGDPQPSGWGRKIVTLLVALIGLAAGGAVGATTLGNRVGPVLADRAIASAESEAEGEGEGGPSMLHLIDNLVVNPARSGGTRFLLTSIAIQVNEASQTDLVALHDVEIRDALIVVLGAKTVEQLTNIENRVEIGRQIEEAVVRIMGPDVIHKIYIPQFVIQ
jgi:flagellar protein FliL